MGAADAERDVRGFALKFYTEEGNWDLVGNNTPVFFVRDPLKFPDFIHTQKRHPKTNLRSHDRDVGLLVAAPGVAAPGHDPDVGPRPAGGADVHERLRLAHLFALERCRRAVLGEVPLQDPAGPQATTPTTRPRRSSARRARPTRRICSARSRTGEFPRWTVQVQIMPEIDADKTSYNPFDLTKVWPHGDYPPIDIGVLELNRNADNYFAEIEQAAFSPSQHRARHRLLARQDAAGPRLLLCRRASLPARHALRGAAGQRAEGAGAPLPQGRADELLSAARPAIRTPITSRTRSTARWRTRRQEPPLKISGDADRYNHRDRQ